MRGLPPTEESRSYCSAHVGLTLLLDLGSYAIHRVGSNPAVSPSTVVSNQKAAIADCLDEMQVVASVNSNQDYVSGS
jgi:hypothetical protein